MRKRCFAAFERQVDRILTKHTDGYTIYNLMLEKEIAERKGNSRCWSGQDEVTYLQKFRAAITKTIEEIQEEVSALLEKLCAKFSIKQEDIICRKCADRVVSWIDDFELKFEKATGNISRTNQASLELLKGHAISDFRGAFDLMRFYATYRIDKTYRISVISVLVAIASALISLVGVVARFF